MSQPTLPPLLVICGPTATGKTELAVRVAEAVGGEIVSADSMQVYRRMDAGTAKPTAEQRARVPFHLVDIIEPDQPYNVAIFQRQAREAIAQVHARRHLPILCGGSGLYVRAITRAFHFPGGLPPHENPVRGEFEAELEALGAAAMHARLALVDPDSAATISPADAKRIIRALEVQALTGRPFSELQRVDGLGHKQYNLTSFALTCPRPLLYQRTDARVDQMMSAGWLEEVRGLAAEGVDPRATAFQALGYRHLLQYLRTGGELADVVALIKRDTRRFAKRQLTWLRREHDLRWLEWSDEREFEAACETAVSAGAEMAGRLKEA